MNTLDDIDRLRSAEKDAQAVVAKARDEARQIRAETEARVAELRQGSGDALATMRKRVEAETTAEIDAFVTASRERVEAMTHEVADKLATNRGAAVQAVVEALVTA